MYIVIYKYKYMQIHTNTYIYITSLTTAVRATRSKKNDDATSPTRTGEKGKSTKKFQKNYLARGSALSTH